METRRVETFAGFADLREPWNELVADSAAPDVFARHEWFDAWIRVHAAGDRLAIETLWRDGQLVAVAPMRRVREQFRGIAARGLSWLWSGVAPRSSLVAAEPGDVDALLGGIVSRDDWDVLVVPNLPEDEPTTGRFLDGLRQRGLTHQDAAGFESPYLKIETSWDEHWNSLPRERRRYLGKKCMNRLEREGDFRFDRLQTRADLETFLPEMYALSQKSWKAGISSELTPDTPVAQQLVEFARVGLDAGWVRIDTLRLHTQLIAFEYMLVGPRRHSVVRSDFDLEYKYYTPGNSLRLHVVRSLFEEGGVGATEYDLGGDPHPYKLEWCDHIRRHRSLTVANRTWRGRLILTAKNVLLPALRRLRGGSASGDPQEASPA
jgi:CelD/BcsL family acetyltransferase involved in cellulose biosynthesis